MNEKEAGRRAAGAMAGSALALLLLLVAACGAGSGGATATGPAARRPPAAVQPGRTGEPALAVYFARSAGAGGPQLVPVRRPLPEGVRADDSRGRLRAAIEALLAGPTAEERSAGLASALPRGVRLLSVELARPVATLDFSRELEQTGGTTAVATLLDQIALTVASVPGVKGVELRVEGVRVGSEERPFTGEGFLFQRLLPPVDSQLVKGLAPEDALDLWIAAIPDRDAMWRLMGADLRARYGRPEAVDTAAWAEGMGSYRNYTLEAGEVQGGDAGTGEGRRVDVRLSGAARLEGTTENVVYIAHMIWSGGFWRFDGGERAR
ncbi:MAG: GerMN domain-containing protein [Bacillota bacterium]|nr:GerMN domain-containing protein [Bacillota bacterium]